VPGATTIRVQEGENLPWQADIKTPFLAVFGGRLGSSVSFAQSEAKSLIGVKTGKVE